MVCTVTEGGPVSNNKGISLPGNERLGARDVARRTSPTWSSRCRLGVDFIALSFVRSPATSNWCTR